MRKTLIVPLLVFAFVGLVAAGCGGDDDDDDGGDTAATTGTTGAGGPLTKEVFIDLADGVCAQGDKRIDQEADQVFGQGRPSKQQQEEFVTDTVLPEIQIQIDQIRRLTPPEGDEEEVTAILDAAQSAIDEGEQDPSLLVQGGGGADPFAEANRLAREYGLKECGG
jgi:hypothetical protein